MSCVPYLRYADSINALRTVDNEYGCVQRPPDTEMQCSSPAAVRRPRRSFLTLYRRVPSGRRIPPDFLPVSPGGVPDLGQLRLKTPASHVVSSFVSGDCSSAVSKEALRKAWGLSGATGLLWQPMSGERRASLHYSFLGEEQYLLRGRPAQAKTVLLPRLEPSSETVRSPRGDVDGGLGRRRCPVSPISLPSPS
ncbi:hypothetical protein DL765_010577 [Monosporascus sp. GIB2]|nr:hypothetical protein DL765_010577 [Monosporascus sp. GIB2]